MHRTLLTWRATLLAFLLLMLLSPLGAGAQSLDCDDFADPDAAQYLLDLDNDHADSLDADGDGIACNEDGEASQGRAEPLSDEEYVNAVWDEVDIQIESVETVIADLHLVFDESTSDDERTSLVTSINETAQRWTEYPDTAPEFNTPAGYDEIDAAYQTWVASLAGIGEAWQEFWDAPSGSEAEQEAIDDFEAAISAFGGASDDLINLLAEAEAAFLDDTTHIATRTGVAEAPAGARTPTSA